MPKAVKDNHVYWEMRVKRAWEALRRNGEFRDDCMHVRDSRRDQEAFVTGFKRFTEKWGVEWNDPDRSYDQVKSSVRSYRASEASIHGETLAGEVFTDIPVCFAFLLSRLQGYSGPRHLIVQCQEENEMYETLQANTQRQWNHMAQSEWVKHLGDWTPSYKVHLTVDIEADPFEVANRVLNILPVLHDIRVMRGHSEPYGQQVKRKLNTRTTLIGDPYDAGKRFDFGQDDDVFKVWDLKHQGKTDMEIAQKVWPSEYVRGKGRDTATGYKGPLAQRVHDYTQRAEKWIWDIPERVRHSIKVL